MNSKERLMNIFMGKQIDRPALKLWGHTPDMKLTNPDYKPVYDLANKLSDIVISQSSAFDIGLGSTNDSIVSNKSMPIQNTTWIDEYRYIKIKNRELRSINRVSTIGEPAYMMEHLIKDSKDLKAMLSIPYEPYTMDISKFNNAQDKMGNKGIVMFGLDHSVYAIIRMIGSEKFGLMCYDDRGLILEALEIYSKRIIEQVQQVISCGITPVFGWVGPELCTPPLVGFKEFEEFVFNYDKKICDLIHNAGGHVWVHCHGSVGKLLTRFADMGVDVLNPIEPPPQGDITLADAFKVVGDSMGLEGNIEMATLLLESNDVVKKTIDDILIDVSCSSRYIMCPSSGYTEYINPSPQYIQNLMTYLQYSYDKLEKFSK